MYNRYACRDGAFKSCCPPPAPPKPPPRPAPCRPSLLSGLLPQGLDLGDLLLIGVLLMLYLEKKDEDFLIILAVLLF